MEVRSHSAFHTHCGNPAHVRYGHIRLNDVTVWQSSWCGDVPNLRGVNIMLVDPFNCASLESRHFDTWASSSAATELNNYLHRVNHSTVMVGVTADEPRRYLDDTVLSTLRQMGVDVADVQSWGSFAFIAQKDFCTNTVFRKVLTGTESRRQAARFKAIITGIITTGIHSYSGSMELELVNSCCMLDF